MIQYKLIQMGNKGKIILLLIIFPWFLICISCKTEIGKNIQDSGRVPKIEPDYLNVTIPPNVAPMNFTILEEGGPFTVLATSGKTGVQISVRSDDRIIRFPERTWKKLLESSKGDSIKFQVFSSEGNNKTTVSFKPFYMAVAKETIDPYLVYRLIYPGYYSWSEIKIVQRSLESFSEESIVENQIMEKNCANCHSFNSNRADRFMIHIRGSLGGTYFVEDGKITRTDPKIDAMPGWATYPSWHPEGRYVAFSSNQVRQSFYSLPEKKIEVYDLVSSLILYDRKNNEI